MIIMVLRGYSLWLFPAMWQSAIDQVGFTLCQALERETALEKKLEELEQDQQLKR
jgi:hypothetical protein